jgi:aminoglycoside 3-N-acetyltransferase I
MEILKLKSSDLDKFIALIKVFEDVFEMENFTIPPADYLQKQLNNEGFLVFVALKNNEIVGGLTAYRWDQYYSTKPLIYVYDLAVKTAFQRQGIGKLLMSSIVNYGKENSFQEVFVQADVVDDYALDFYRSTGAIAEDVVHFTYLLDD